MKTSIHEIFTWLGEFNTPTQLKQALEALLTEKELQELTNRWQIIKMLRKGSTQREIAQKLGVGIATVSRGAKVYQSKIFDKGSIYE